MIAAKVSATIVSPYFTLNIRILWIGILNSKFFTLQNGFTYYMMMYHSIFC